MGFSSQTHFTAEGACDLVLAQLRWPDGLLGSFAASFMTPEGMATNGFDLLEVFGDGWAARTHSNPRPIEVWDDRARWPMALEIRTDPSGPTGMMAAVYGAGGLRRVRRAPGLARCPAARP